MSKCGRDMFLFCLHFIWDKEKHCYNPILIVKNIGFVWNYVKMSTKFSCRFCKEQFDVPKGLYKHLQTAHNAGISRDNRTCPICGVSCSKYESYRDHLLYIHGQSEDGLKLTFKTLNGNCIFTTSYLFSFVIAYIYLFLVFLFPLIVNSYWLVWNNKFIYIYFFFYLFFIEIDKKKKII